MDHDANAGKDGEGEKDGPKTLSFTEVLALSDEDFDKLPADQQPDREPLLAFQKSVVETATVAARTTFVEEQRLESERVAAQNRDKAGVQTEVDWINDLDGRRTSADPEVAAKAAKEFGDNVERYQNAAAAKRDTGHAAVSREVLASHYREMLPGAEAAFEGVTASLIENKDTLNGNTLLGVARFADEKGYARGLAEGADQKEREQNVDRGAKGAPGGGDRVSAGGGNEKRLDTDFTKRGAGRDHFRAAYELGERS